jgi:hypothetical protein
MTDETPIVPPSDVETPVEVVSPGQVATREPVSAEAAVAAALDRQAEAAPAPKRGRGRPRKDGRPSGSVAPRPTTTGETSRPEISTEDVAPEFVPDPEAIKLFVELGEMGVDAAHEFIAGRAETTAKEIGLDKSDVAGLVARLHPGKKRDWIAKQFGAVMGKYDVANRFGPEAALIGGVLAYGAQCALVLAELKRMAGEVQRK